MAILTYQFVDVIIKLYVLLNTNSRNDHSNISICRDTETDRERETQRKNRDREREETELHMSSLDPACTDGRWPSLPGDF